MQSTSGYHRVNGLKLYVHRFREPEAVPSGLTLLFLHGFLDAGASWDLVAPILARAGHEVIAPDLRGFGQSDWVGAGGYYHFTDYVADLSELVDTLAPAAEPGAAPRRLGLVGHSMGGTVAALLAGARPELFERLALLEGLGPLANEPTIAVDRMRAWLRGLRELQRAPKVLTSMQEVLERLALHHPRVPRDVLATRATLLTRKDEQGNLVWAYDPLHRTTAPTPFQAPAFEAFLAQIPCPVLIVSGGKAGWHTPDEERRIACLAKTREVEIPDAGHMMHWTAPEALADHLLRFFGAPLTLPGALA